MSSAKPKGRFGRPLDFQHTQLLKPQPRVFFAQTLTFRDSLRELSFQSLVTAPESKFRVKRETAITLDNRPRYDGVLI